MVAASIGTALAVVSGISDSTALDEDGRLAREEKWSEVMRRWAYSVRGIVGFTSWVVRGCADCPESSGGVGAHGGHRSGGGAGGPAQLVGNGGGVEPRGRAADRDGGDGPAVGTEHRGGNAHGVRVSLASVVRDAVAAHRAQVGREPERRGDGGRCEPRQFRGEHRGPCGAG